ncbi:MAG: acyl-CoA thioesterase [Leptolyngbya sp. DLM2.Bin15]|nr:MAG: acyl-CoA thioesterase [Leptolyngbya sp. DLM2.Bin15]
MSSEIKPYGTLQANTHITSDRWFEYGVHAYPNHTDYSGAVWHGTYLAWMEEARVDYLRQMGVSFADLVELGCDLPVVDLTIRYHRALRMGESAIVRARMQDMSGVRMTWDYEIQSLDRQETYVSAQVVLVPVDRDKGKIMRRLPANIQEALMKLAQ